MQARFAVAWWVVTSCFCWAQGSRDFSREHSQLWVWVAEGDYAKAEALNKLTMEWALNGDRDLETRRMLPTLLKAAVETGRMGDAIKILDSAAKWPIEGSKHGMYEGALLREQAAYFAALGNWREAAEAASRAVDESSSYRRIRRDSARSLLALALLRLGKTEYAYGLALDAAKSVSGKPENEPSLAPRILYTACLATMIRTRDAKQAEPYCRRGLDGALRERLKETRDAVLGKLAYAEFWLLSGDLTRSRESATAAMELSKKLFGAVHQDTAEALGILAALDEREGKVESAMVRRGDAERIRVALRTGMGN